MALNVFVRFQSDGNAAVNTAIKQVQSNLNTLPQAAKNASSATASASQRMVQGIDSVRVALRSLGIVFGSLAVIRFFTNAVRDAGRLYDLSKSIGITTEALQRLQFAAGQMGSSAEALNIGIQFLSKNLGEAALGLAADQKLFDALNITSKTADQALLQLADTFSGIQDASLKAALAAKIFGRGSGPELVAFLSQGSKAITEQMQVASVYGDEISQIADQAADDWAAFASFAQTTALQVLFSAFEIVGRGFKFVSDEIARLDALMNPLAAKYPNAASSVIVSLQGFNAKPTKPFDKGQLTGLLGGSSDKQQSLFGTGLDLTGGLKEAGEAFRKFFDETREGWASVQEGIANGIKSFLDIMITGTHDFGEAFVALWQSILDAVLQKIADFIASAIVEELFSIVLSISTGGLGGGLFGGLLDGIFQSGGSRVVSRPTLFMAGEAGPERVQFSPLGGGTYGQESGVSVHIAPGAIIDFMSVNRFARRIGRAVATNQRRAVA